MKHLLLFLIIIVGFLILQCINLKSFEDLELFKDLESFEDLDYKSPNADIKISKKINSRGVFALKDYKEGDIIEVCPCIADDTTKFSGLTEDYLFKYDSKTPLIAFGYCSMYNHSNDYNALWKVISKEKMKIYATKNISMGEEIFISYGDGYWKSRESSARIKKI